MHYLTSNFNLMDTNSHWDKLKKSDTVLDKNYNGLIISLNKKNLEKYNFFHSIIYIDSSNSNQTLKELKIMFQLLKKNKRKNFFYIFYIIFMKTLFRKKYLMINF